MHPSIGGQHRYGSRSLCCPGHATRERIFMTTKETAPPKSRTPSLLGWAGALTIALGLFLLLRPLGGCGSVLNPDIGAAQIADAVYGGSSSTRRCLERLDTATVPAWVVACAGLLIIITAIMLKTMANRQPAVPVVAAAGEPSLVEELEKLAALRNSGAITEEEFEQSKASILGRRG